MCPSVNTITIIDSMLRCTAAAADDDDDDDDDVTSLTA